MTRKWAQTPVQVTVGPSCLTNFPLPSDLVFHSAIEIYIFHPENLQLPAINETSLNFLIW